MNGFGGDICGLIRALFYIAVPGLIAIVAWLLVGVVWLFQHVRFAP